MIAPDDVRRAEWVVDTSGVVRLLSEGIRRDRRGRPQNLATLRLWFVGTLLAIQFERSATTTMVIKVLHQELPVSEQRRLGVIDADGNVVVTRHALDYWTKRLARDLALGARVDAAGGEASAEPVLVADGLGGFEEIVDGDGTATSGTPDGVVPADAADAQDDGEDDGEGGVSAEAGVVIDDAERARRLALIGACSDALMDVFDLGWTSTTYAVDATGLWAWHRASTIGGKGDADASWGGKTSKRGETEMFYGFEEHTMVRVNKPGSAADDPALIARLRLTSASSDVVDVTLEMIDSLATGVTDVLVDRHYSYKAPERWQQRLLERGVRQHMDLRVDDHGFAEYDQMRWAAGRPHCPFTPDELAVIKRPHPSADVADKRAFSAQIDRRAQYAMAVHRQLDASGKMRVRCPALDGRIGCTRRPASVQVAMANGLTVIDPPPPPAGTAMPRVCTGAAPVVEVPMPLRKMYQPLYWGSREWTELYGKRSLVEGSYGNRKNASTENLNRKLTVLAGLGRRSLVLSLVACSYNLRMIDNWKQRRLAAGRPVDMTHELLRDRVRPVGYELVTTLAADPAAETPADAAGGPVAGVAA